MEFEAFPKIGKIGKLFMTITQKIHGTNAQVVIQGPLESVGEEDTKLTQYKVDDDYYIVRAGSKNRWIFVGDDNYGFARWVSDNAEALAKALGPGQHFGEWAGPGINSGEGLQEKTFCLFDVWRYKDVELPKNVTTVPVLYEGKIDLEAIDRVMEDLKTNGSKLVPGFMRPEGVVVSLLGSRLKKVFNPEDTKWTGASKKKAPKQEAADYSYLLQPIRLEKLLSKDESYVREYPKSLGTIVRDYMNDLVEEGQISGDEDEIKAVRKGASGQVFQFVKTIVGEQLNG
jgi:hypothetical protein